LTFEDFLISLNGTAPTLSDKSLRLLLHLVATAIQGGTYTITASDRELGKAAGIGDSRMNEVKQQLAGIMAVETRRGCASTFRLPADWFPLQASLFSSTGDPKVRSLLTPSWGLTQPRNGATGDPGMGPGDPVSGPQRPQTGVGLTPFRGQSDPGMGLLDPLVGSPSTQNQQDASSPSISISSSEVTSREREYVISILSKRFLAADKRPEATILGAELQGVLHRLGNVQVAARLPDDVVLAQCLAIAPLRELLPALALAKARHGRPKSYAWAVSVFLEAIAGIDRGKVKLIRYEMAQMRQAKPPGRAEPLPFPDQLVKAAAGQVKSLR